MSTLEARIAEVLAAHQWYDATTDNEDPATGCTGCDDWFGDENAVDDGTFAAHQAAALAPVIAEVRKDERHHVIQDIREQCEYEPPQIGDYGRVELEGYITITNPELDAIENGAGFDRMCMSVTEWEAGLAEAQAEALDAGYTVGNAHNGRRDTNHYRADKLGTL